MTRNVGNIKCVRVGEDLTTPLCRGRRDRDARGKPSNGTRALFAWTRLPPWYAAGARLPCCARRARGGGGESGCGCALCKANTASASLHVYRLAFTYSVSEASLLLRFLQVKCSMSDKFDHSTPAITIFSFSNNFPPKKLFFFKKKYHFIPTYKYMYSAK